MSPAEFTERYLSLLLPVTPPLDLKIDEFARFSNTKVTKLNISQADKEILVISGLPKDCAPFLTFGLSDNNQLEPLNELPNCKIIGFNGYGDPICIDELDGGTIVYFNHDRDMQRVFINSSVRSLAYSLCTYLEFRQTQAAQRCCRKIFEYDRKAMAENSFWSAEIGVRAN